MGKTTTTKTGWKMRYRPMRAGEEAAVSRLALTSFDEFVAPDYTAEGISEIQEIFSAPAINRRGRAGHFVLLAEFRTELAGMIEVRENRHISMLFVDKKYHRRGAGGELIRRALERAASMDDSVDEYTVNSSPFAVQAYERMGFTAAGSEQTVNGIRFIPMRKPR